MNINLFLFVVLFWSDLHQGIDRGSYFQACIKGDLRIVREYLDNEGDVNIKDNQGVTGLNFAAAYNHMQLVKFLLENGANTEIKDNNGWTPLISIAQLGKDRTDIARMILDKGANINAVDMDGFSSLHIAIDNQYLRLAKLLIEKGIDINIKTKLDKETALHKAVRNQYSEIVNLLLKNGAKVNIANSDGLTALDIAKEEGFIEIAEVLGEYSKKEISNVVKKKKSIKKR